MKRRVTGLVAVLVLLGAGLATYAWAAASDSQTINACVGADGKLSLAGSAADCKKGETPLSWNTVGPQGTAGPQGVPGPPGPSAGDPDSASATLSVTGARQGLFSATPLVVTGLSHEIVSPRDAGSGQATGKRQHKPFVIVKELDKASPLLLKALVTNENLTTVLIGLNKGGQQIATIKLTNAQISDYVANGVTEHWSFTYQKIEWTYLDGGITAEDEWDART